MMRVLLIASTLGLGLAAHAQRPDGPMPTPKEVVAAADTDKSGDVSLAEWTAAGRREQGFTFMDANADGKLTEAEITEGFKQMAARRAGR
ncbi:EF-hand domain-containing protein [bacterium]|nr:EF-hand domain-containing protein [bacterium]